ncbi:MAG: hypothetical protein HeimC2_28550 [Candidatus Heimdallarchaeota archaeon LC_2]|nr:MAG: hypothetical protein HeimC2_28550 [Candidatus Heimdallarchaeota archaeon LC_2]
MINQYEEELISIRLGLIVVVLLLYQSCGTLGTIQDLGSLDPDRTPTSGFIEITNKDNFIIDEIRLDINDTTLGDITSFIYISKSSNITIKDVVIASPSLMSFNPSFLFTILDSVDIKIKNITIIDIDTTLELELFHAERSENITIINSTFENIRAKKLIMFNMLSCSFVVVAENTLGNLSSDTVLNTFNFKNDKSSIITSNSIDQVTSSHYNLLEFVDNSDTEFLSNNILNITTDTMELFTANDNIDNHIAGNLISSTGSNYTTSIFDNTNTVFEDNLFSVNNKILPIQEYKVILLNPDLTLFYNESKPFRTFLHWNISEIGGMIYLVQNGWKQVEEADFTSNLSYSHDVIYYTNSSTNFTLTVVSVDNNVYTLFIPVSLIYYESPSVDPNPTSVISRDDSNNKSFLVIILGVIFISAALLYRSRIYLNTKFTKFKEGKIGKFLKEWRKRYRQ